MRYHLCMSQLSRAKTSISENHLLAISGETRPVLIANNAFVGPLQTVYYGSPLPISAKLGLSVQDNTVLLSFHALTEWIIQYMYRCVKRHYLLFLYSSQAESCSSDVDSVKIVTLSPP